MTDIKIWASVLLELTPVGKRETLGVTALREGLKPGMGLGVEVFITFILAFTVAASFDRTRNDLSGSAPLTIGLTVTACHLFAVSNLILRSLKVTIFYYCCLFFVGRRHDW